MDRPVTIALVVAAVLVAQPGLPGAGVVTTLTAIAILLAVGLRRPIAPVVIGVMLVAGVAFRASAQIHTGSDVMQVTAAAIQQVLAGGNPYGVGYDVSRPPGAPFPYGPLALLWYAPLQANGWVLELVVSCVVLNLLALRGRMLGLAIYAFGPTLIPTASDGSNDTSVGLVLLGAFTLGRRRPILGAALLAIAVALKPYAAAWAPAFLVWGGWPVIVTFIAASAVLWLPVMLVWGVGKFLTSLDLANATHVRPYWSLGALYETLAGPPAPRAALDQARIILGTAMAVATLRWSRSLDGVILAGTLVYLVTLYAGFWSTYAYFGAIAPILCWRIDDWLGLESRPLVQPPDEPEAPISTEREASAAAAS